MVHKTLDLAFYKGWISGLFDIRFIPTTFILYTVYSVHITRVAGPGGVDPDPTFKKKLAKEQGPDPDTR